jgi:hypothetical protein
MIKSKKVYLIVALYLIAVTGYTQDWARINQLTYDAEYFFMTRQYEKAIRSYGQILKQLPDNGNIFYKLGVCYLMTDAEKDKSIPYFIEASKRINKNYKPDSHKEEGAPPETYFLLGSAYRVANDLDKAIDSYNEYLNILGSKDVKQRQVTEHYITSCRNASDMMQNPVFASLTNLGPPINDDFKNFNAVISGDGNTMAYTTTKKDMNNIMVVRRTNGIWSKPKLVTREITSKNNFKTTGISFDGNTLYLVEEDPINSEIYVTSFNKGRWSSATKPGKTINSKSNETHASLSPDGKTLYFTSDRSGGFGDFDIYFSKLDEKGKWGKPENMGPKINTMYNEETPFISPDGKRLYFSSEGHSGMGGLDVYYFDLQEYGSQPVNLGYPINTTDNDMFYFPGTTKNSGYMSRIEKSEYSHSDIYFVEIVPAVNLRGKIIPENSPYFVDTALFKITLEDKTLNTTVELKTTGTAGDFTKKITPGNYKLTVSGEGYENFTHEISLDKEYEKSEVFVGANMIYISTEPVEEPALFITEEIKEEVSAIAFFTEKKETVQEILPATQKTEEVVKLTENITPVKNEKMALTSETASVSKNTAPEKKVPVSNPSPSYAFIDEVVNELNDISSIPPGTPVTYTVQLYALRNPVDPGKLKNIQNVTVNYASDKLYKYTWGTAFSLQEAMKLKEEVKTKGYQDVILRRRAIVPAYTIQVMAGKNSLDFGYFNKFDKIRVTLGQDGYYRYCYGEYSNSDDAEAELTRLKNLGYTNLYIKKTGK